jgi:hypothetical protein
MLGAWVGGGEWVVSGRQAVSVAYIREGSLSSSSVFKLLDVGGVECYKSVGEIWSGYC